MCLLEKGPSLNYSSSKKDDSALTFRSSGRILTLRRFPRSSLVAKESGIAHEPSPMRTSIKETS